MDRLDQQSTDETPNSTADDTVADSSTIDRRSVMAALGTAAAGSALVPSVSTATTGSNSTDPVLERGPFELPAWRQTEHHEATSTPLGGDTDDSGSPGEISDLMGEGCACEGDDDESCWLPDAVSNVTGRETVSVTRSLSQVNMKLWENDDAARAECNGDVGHQHRFIATTTLYTGAKSYLSWYYDKYVRDGAEVANPPLEGRGGIESAQSIAEIADGADNADACGAVTFRINNVYSQRFTLPVLSDGDTLYGEYTYEDLKSDVEKFQRNRGRRNSEMPDDHDGVATLANSGLGILSDPSVGGLMGTYATSLESLSGYSDAFEYAAKGPKMISTLSGYAGVAKSTLNFLGGLDDAFGFKASLDWADNGVSMSADGFGRKAVSVQFVDFTVTVPPGENDSGGTTVEVEQNFGLEPEDDEPEYFGGHRPDDDGLMLTDFTWEIEVPSYDVDDFDGVDELPTAYVVGDDGRTKYTSAPKPDPRIGIRRCDGGDAVSVDESDTLTETDSILFDALGVEDDGNTNYRWRIYKNGGKIRPAILYGPSAKLGKGLLDRTNEVTFNAFGPGEYVVELTVRNRYGKTATTSKTFVVEPVEKSGTELTLRTQKREVTVGEPVTFSLDGVVGRDGEEGSVDLVEWEFQYPQAVSGGVVQNLTGEADVTERRDAGVDLSKDTIETDPTDPVTTTVERTFEYPGIHRVAVRAFSVPDEDGETGGPENVKDVYYSGDRSIKKADKRDITVVVTPEESATRADTGAGPLPWGVQHR